ncbi:MAG TPA: metal-dependent hydrolase [candidate division Zixibacteria bacterium]|nr:metal-dependent hydrolase [candidate division Zixibacteria bacterium]MDD4917069.1 metal-dependent hydrolase [candidate division Zixibacteria bacterium]MDM7972949.1 metal-dependent hydrolase [candidate division Zixibacteria bacterium]HOD65295.1 metal-dependent hydrolase [candidate division Zixibacteria bacterium]HOZ07133.1 metal-dependent hydrolase [candidate division Zixibacteria bacterium]
MPHIQWLGHSCVTITEGPHKLIIDPFLKDNPKGAAKPETIDIGWILLTHGHGDHVGDAVAIGKRTGATVIASFELANLCAKEGLKVHPMHIGGSHEFPFGRVKLTIAHHGGGYGPDASRYTGPPVGFLVTIGGKTIYHPGDTGLFLDMRLIGEMNRIDLAFLPIGDNFTMGIADAVKAVEFLQPKVVIPIHYGTWDLIAADPAEFAGKVRGARVELLSPGGRYTL